MIDRVIGQRIRDLRIMNRMTQEELAKALGYKSRSTINKIESGINDITQSKIEKFAKILNTSTAYLMGWDENIDLNLNDYLNNFSLSADLKKIPSNYYKILLDYLKSCKNGTSENVLKMCAEICNKTSSELKNDWGFKLMDDLEKKAYYNRVLEVINIYENLQKEISVLQTVSNELKNTHYNLYKELCDLNEENTIAPCEYFNKDDNAFLCISEIYQNIYSRLPSMRLKKRIAFLKRLLVIEEKIAHFYDIIDTKHKTYITPSKKNTKN